MWQVDKRYGRKTGHRDKNGQWITTGPSHSLFEVIAVSASGVALVRDVKHPCHGVRMPEHFDKYEEMD